MSLYQILCIFVKNLFLLSHFSFNPPTPSSSFSLLSPLITSQITGLGETFEGLVPSTMHRDHQDDSTQTWEEWKNLGNQHYRDKNYKDAVDCYSKALDLDASNASLFTNRAAAHIMLLDHSSSIADCDRAIAADPAFSKAYFRKASSLRSIGKLDEALACLHSGLELDNDNQGTWEHTSHFLLSFFFSFYFFFPTPPSSSSFPVSFLITFRVSSLP